MKVIQALEVSKATWCVLKVSQRLNAIKIKISPQTFKGQYY